MKILIASDFYKNNLGGVTTSIIGLYEGLLSKGHDVKILTLANNNKSYKKDNVYYIKSFPVYYAPDMRMSLALRDPLLKEIEEWNPDIIHVQSEGSAFLMSRMIRRKCKCPLIITCHTDYAYYVFGERRKNPIIEAITKIVAYVVYKPATKIVVPSKKALNFPFLKAFKDRLVVIPNGIKIEEKSLKLSNSERQTMLETLGIDENKKILVAITRLSKEKNIEEIIKYLPGLLNKNKNVVLLIVGAGPDKQHLLDIVKELNLESSVVFVDRKPENEVWHYYALGDVFVSASTFEVHSMSYLEAMAEGLPLLCRSDEALDGVLEHRVNGLIYNNQTEFVEYANKLLSDDKFRKQMCLGSLNKIKEFSAELFAQKALDLYKKLIAEKI